MDKLESIIKRYMVIVNNRNTTELRSELVKALHTYYDDTNDCTQSRMSTIFLQYRGKSFSILNFADFFRAPPIVVLAIYDVYGFEISHLLTGIGRELVYNRGFVTDKIELGNRYYIPWRLLDAHRENYVLYAELIRQYTTFDRAHGELGNPKVQSSTKAFAEKKASINDFEKLLRRANIAIGIVEESPKRKRRDALAVLGSVANSKKG